MTSTDRTAARRGERLASSCGWSPAQLGCAMPAVIKIDGATHIETYWVPKYVDAAMNKLTEFYGRTLRK